MTESESIDYQLDKAGALVKEALRIGRRTS